MHYLYFVRVPKEKAETSKEARTSVENILESEGFAGEGGYFSSSKSDWFVIGGRWSGELQRLLMKKDFFEVVKDKYKSHKGMSVYGMSSDLVKKEKDNLQKIWEEIGGKHLNPYNRDTYNQEGYEDDAIIITKELLKALKKKAYNETEVFDTEHCDEYLVKDLDKDSIGSWLVVVDYHN